MSLYCDDGLLADMPALGPPAPRPARAEPWKPPEVTLCQRCGQVGWKHRSYPPLLCDEMDRAIYAAAFVELALRDPIKPIADVVREAERLVDLHRRARSGT